MRIKTKEDRRDRIKFRIRKRMTGTSAKPRLKSAPRPGNAKPPKNNCRSGEAFGTPGRVNVNIELSQMIIGIFCSIFDSQHMRTFR